MRFLGREREKALLRDWVNRTDRACLGVVYGRRRVGKTRLVEESLGEFDVLKFEGLEGQPSAVQQRHFLDRLAELTARREYKLIQTSNWTDILILLAEYVASRPRENPIIVFFDEFPWMAAGRTRLVSSLKYVWDNHFSMKGRVRLLLCGSVCSFLVKKVIRSRALYGRIDLEVDLKPLRLPEIVDVFRPKRSLKEVVELYMALGGIPESQALHGGAGSHQRIARDGRAGAGAVLPSRARSGQTVRVSMQTGRVFLSSTFRGRGSPV